MENKAVKIIYDEMNRPKKSVSYQYIRGLINMAYMLNKIDGQTRSDLMKEAENFTTR